ncbi:MAG TPA: nuclear transport factor 2 family protein [Blastocatellia bacterium]
MSTSSSGKSEKSADTRQAILLLEDEIFNAIKSRDANSLERVLTDDFVYRSPGQEVAKDDFLELCAKFPYEITSIQGKELKVNVYDGLVVVTGLQSAKTKGDDGKEVTSVVAFTDIFVKQKDKWMLSLAHAVDLPQAADQRS